MLRCKVLKILDFLSGNKSTRMADLERIADTQQPSWPAWRLHTNILTRGQIGASNEEAWPHD